MQPIFDSELLVGASAAPWPPPCRARRSCSTAPSDDLGERLATVERRFDKAAALFCLTRAAGDAVLASGKAGSVLRVEADAALLGGDDGRVGSLDRIPLEPESIDLAVSLLSLHEANDIPGALIQIRRALRPDGLFLGAMAGGGTLAELRESLIAAETELYGGASPRVAPFTDVRDAGALLQRAGFALPVADVETRDRALRHDVRADAGFARHGRVQRAGRPLAAARLAAAFHARRRDLCRALRRSGRAGQGDLRLHLDVRLGAARLAAEAAEAGQRHRVVDRDPEVAAS